jgi:hypothetical protein
MTMPGDKRRWVRGGHVAAGLAVVAVSLVLQAVPGLGQVAPSASVSVDRQSGAVGEALGVSGSGWVSGGLVQVEICGNEGLNGSPDCAVAEGTTVGVGTDGTWSSHVLVWTPPKPCPCVVAVRSVDSDVTASTPFAIVGATQAPPTRESGRRSATGSLSVRDVRLEQTSSVASWFGVPPSPVLVLTVTNIGASPADNVEINVATTSSSALMVIDPVGHLAPGESQTIRIPIPGDVGILGSYRVSGDVAGVAFSVDASTYPGGLLAIVLILIGTAVWWVWQRRRRYHRSADAGPGEAPTEEVRAAAAATWVPASVPGATGEGVPVPSAQVVNWFSFQADLDEAIQVAVRRILERTDHVTGEEIQAEAEGVTRSIVATFHLDASAATTLERALTDELTRIRVARQSS